LVIGLERDVVRLVPYSPEWARLFLEEERRLRALIGSYVIDIQHVGSTAIPGMIAKPIIDIAIAIARFEEGERCVEPIESLGYEYRGEHGIPGRHYFVKGDPRTYHIHVLEHDSREWVKHIVFRDSLRQDRQAAKEYARLKRSLAEKHPNDRAAYTEGKTEFVAYVLERAGYG
jgi:GrpB-like predicted nucleotidyltransferase (UPF0157 family)